MEDHVFLPTIDDAELRRLDLIANTGARYKKRNGIDSVVINCAANPFDKWVLDLGMREASHLLECAGVAR